MRSTMARLSRRSGVFSGSLAAAPTDGRVTPQAVRPAAPRTPPPPPPRPAPRPRRRRLRSAPLPSVTSRPGSVFQLRVGTELIVFRICWGQWSKDCLRNVRKAGSAKTLFVSTVIVSVTSLSFILANIWSWKQDSDALIARVRRDRVDPEA